MKIIIDLVSNGYTVRTNDGANWTEWVFVGPAETAEFVEGLLTPIDVEAACKEILDADPGGGLCAA